MISEIELEIDACEVWSSLDEDRFLEWESKINKEVLEQINMKRSFTT